MFAGCFFRFVRRAAGCRASGAAEGCEGKAVSQVRPVWRSEQESAGCSGPDGLGMAGVDDAFESVVVGLADLPVVVFEEEQGEYEDAGDGKCDEYGHSVVHDGSFPLCVRADVTHFQDYCVLYGFCFGFF